MIFPQNRHALRTVYRNAWQKHQDNLPMSALETQVVQIMQQHPEYLAAVTESLDKDYDGKDGQTNPFMHLALHLAVRDQIATDRPAGIAARFSALCKQIGNQHEAEHCLGELMAYELWRAQSQSTPPDEQKYLKNINKLLKRRL